jgi:hypothetical protein
MFREPGHSKERRLEPQITIGLLTDQDGFPLMVSPFEGNELRHTFVTAMSPPARRASCDMAVTAPAPHPAALPDLYLRIPGC